MTNETQPENVTEQMFRETSEHFMSELNKKDKTIRFLKNRLKEVEFQKNFIEKSRDKIVYALKLQCQMLDASSSNIFDMLGEIQNRTACINDNTRSLDGDIEDYLENYVEVIDLTDSDLDSS
jgi:hypothetical protein